MNKIISLLILLVGLSACNTIMNMTKEEKELTYSDAVDVSFRVLSVDNKEDSLVLRKKSIDIENPEKIAEDKDWQYFIERLKMTMAEESGVGIAAVQVGVHRNLFLFMRLDKPDRPVEVAINPKIVSMSDTIICFENDGCLSVPDKSGNTKRYPEITVEYYNEKGNLIKETLRGESRGGDFAGVIFQHEFDHLQGVLFTDKLYEE